GPDLFTAAAVDRLVHRDAVAMIDAGRCRDAADQAGPQVAEQIAIQVAGRHDLELLRAAYELHAAVVHDHFLGLNLWVFLGRRAEALKAQAVGQFQNVGFVDAVERLAALLSGQVERKVEKPPARGRRHDLQTLYDAGDDFVLDRRVEVL